MESSMTNDMHLGTEQTDSCHPSGVPTESAVCGQQELHNLLNVLRPYGTARNPVGVTDIKQADLSPAFTDQDISIIIAGPFHLSSEGFWAKLLTDCKRIKKRVQKLTKCFM